MLVNIDKLLDYMGGVNLTEKQRDHAEFVILPGVQQQLETHLSRPVELTHVREQRVPNNQGYIVFTVTPVWKINFITRWDGVAVEIPLAPPDANVPEFEEHAGVRNVNYAGDGSGNSLALPYEFFVGQPYQSPYWPLVAPLSQQEPYYIADYLGGWNGYTIEGLELAICRVAARETERQFDDTQSIKGGVQDAAADSDSRDKYWTDDELTAWDRWRRRNIV